MPIVRIDLLAGRTREAKDALVANVTRAVVESIGCPLEAVQVLLYEVDKADWARGGVSHAQKAAAAEQAAKKP
ncbi:MAG TPA: 2-hydroxymuconate tautomerase [Myxococcales bacterium]